VCNLLGVVAMFGKRYMMNYLLLFHIFETTSVNARWRQLWLIQPQSFSKQVSGWMLLYVCHATECGLKGWNFNKLCFEPAWLLPVISWSPLRTWMWTNPRKPSIYQRRKCVKLSNLLMVNAEKWGAKLEKWGSMPTCYPWTFMCCLFCLPVFQCV